MTRYTVFLLLTTAGGLLFWLVGSSDYLFHGAFLGAVAWLIWDSYQLQKLEDLLRRTRVSQDLEDSSGPWKLLIERLRYLLRGREQQLALSDQRLDDFLQAIQASPNGVILLDSQFRIEWCNHTAAQLFGLDAQRDVMQHITNLVRAPEFLSYLHARQYDVERTFDPPDSTASRPRRISVQIHPYGTDSQHQPSKLLLLAQDVTQLAMAEAQRRDFVANASHEIRTPLTIVAGFVEALQNLPLDETQRKRYLRLISEQTTRMQSLVRDLLTLSRLDNGVAPTSGTGIKTTNFITRLASEAEGLNKTVVDSPPDRIKFENTMPDATLIGDPEELISAAGNLVQNAIRHTPANTPIEVSLRLAENGHALFEVKDRGPGIAAEHLPRLTERFYRVDSSRSRENGGTGLGLAIVKHIVQRHGGEMRIASILGQGSSFGFTLPASRVQIDSQPSDQSVRSAAAVIE